MCFRLFCFKSLISNIQNIDESDTNGECSDKNINRSTNLKCRNTNGECSDTNYKCSDTNGIDELNQILELNKYSKTSAPKLHTMNGRELWCKVIDVYDGDTVDIIFFQSNELLHYKLRLYGIDTPELKPLKSMTNRDNVIERARDAKKKLESLVLNKVVYVRFKNEEKYGRLMGDIYLSKSPGKKSVNQMMLDCGMAVPYFGQKK